MVAIALAQQAIGSYDLGGEGRPIHELVTSTEPCAMCLGAIPWSGVRRVLCGARGEDACEIGFDEGAKPADWVGRVAQAGNRGRPRHPAGRGPGRAATVRRDGRHDLQRRSRTRSSACRLSARIADSCRQGLRAPEHSGPAVTGAGRHGHDAQMLLDAGQTLVHLRQPGVDRVELGRRGVELVASTSVDGKSREVRSVRSMCRSMRRS